MLQATRMLLSLQERGATIGVQDDQLQLRAPKGLLCPEEIEILRIRRREIVELVRGTLSIASVPIESQNRSAHIPLTAMQKMPWYLAATAHPRIPVGIRLSGSLNFEALANTVDALVRRHEPLRTRIVTIGGKLCQHIDSCRGYQLELVDMTNTSSNDVERSVHTLIQEFIDQRVDPSIGPLFDAKVFKTAEREHILVISVDNLVTDDTSVGILIEELLTTYKQEVIGGAAIRPPPPLQFADYALWLEKISSTWQNVRGPYWEERLAAAPGIQWPADINTADRCKLGDGALKIPLGERLTVGLDEFARRERTLPALVVLAGYVIAVSKWCNQSDLTITLEDRGRHRPELVDMLGTFATHLQLRFQLTKSQRCHEILDLIKTEFSSTLYHRDFGWTSEMIPQFQPGVLFNWSPEWARFSSLGISDTLSVEWLDLAVSNKAVAGLNYGVPYKLALLYGYEGRELTPTLGYGAGLFSAQTLNNFAQDLRHAVESIVFGPSSDIAIPRDN